MIGTGKLKNRSVILYKDGGCANAYLVPSTKNWDVDVWQETKWAYQVRVHSDLFNPDNFWVRKADLDFYPNKVTPSIGLETGDEMVLSDKNGTRIGVWTFKKE